MENKWRASRYGLDGLLIDFGKQEEVPLRTLMHEYLALVDDVLDELNSATRSTTSIRCWRWAAAPTDN